MSDSDPPGSPIPDEELRQQILADPKVQEAILSGLFAALHHPDPVARRVALLNLGRVGAAAFPAVPALYGILTQDDELELRQLAADVLGGLGERTLPLLVRALGSENEVTVEAAKDGLRAQGIRASDLLPALLAVSRDDDPYYRLQAIAALSDALNGRIDASYFVFDRDIIRQALDTWHQALNDSDELTRILAAHALWVFDRDAAGLTAVEEIAKRSESEYANLALELRDAMRIGLEADD